MIITALITTRNRAALLREAIESALRQEPCGHEVEILVVDDGSTDETPQVMAEYPTVRYAPTRQGSAGGSRNYGIGLAQGDWIAFLDDDDVWTPDKLRVCADLMATHPQARMLFSAATICDFDLQPGVTFAGPDLAGHASSYEAFLDDLPATSGVLLHKDILEKIGGFPTDIPYGEDRDLWYRVLLAGFDCAAATQSLVQYRLRPQVNGELAFRYYTDTMTVIRRHFAPGQPQRPAWKRRQQVLWRTRGWYAHQMMTAARQAQAEDKGRLAARFRRLAFTISPLHGLKLLLASGG